MPNPMPKTSRAKVKRNLLFKKTPNGTALVVNLQTGLYYTLNGTAEAIWASIKKEKSIQQIVANIVKLFKITPLKAEREVTRYLQKLEKEKLVTIIRK